MSDALSAIYGELRTTFLVPVAEGLESYLRECLKDVPRVDRIVCRAKTTKSFTTKAAKQEDGKPKYDEPLSQIQDMIGARVVVFFTNDVATTKESLLKYLRAIEIQTLIPESSWAFGYVGEHLILKIPEDVVPKDLTLKDGPSFFELQIKTLYQHAWSEAQHDLGYKPVEKLSGDQQKRLAYTAAHSWGADRVFNELAVELSDS